MSTSPKPSQLHAVRPKPLQRFITDAEKHHLPLVNQGGKYPVVSSLDMTRREDEQLQRLIGKK